MKKEKLALTTGQAARCCFVSPDTILNWIKAGRLVAQRTVGGQYRIRASSLRDFMRSMEMSTDVLDGHQNTRPMCWAFHEGRKACSGCLVKYLGVRDCFKLMGMRPEADSQKDCEKCEFYQRFGRKTNHFPEER